MEKVIINGEEAQPIKKVKIGEEQKKSINELVKESPKWKDKIKKLTQ